MNVKEKILRNLKTEGNLPSLPDVVISIHEMIQRDEANARDLARIVETDPVLAGNILKLSNSVYYARSADPIRTLPVAVTKIGYATLMKLVFALKVCPLFSDSPVLGGREFWTHSLSVAILTQALSQRMRADREQQDISYLAGLMHDVGIMVLGYLIPEEYDAFVNGMRDSDQPLIAREQEALGIDHAEIGAIYIDQWWNLDPFVTSAVRYHHEQLQPLDGCRSFQLVHAANCIMNSQNVTNGITRTSGDPASVLAELGLTPQSLEPILEDVRTSRAQAEELVYSYVTW